MSCFGARWSRHFRRGQSLVEVALVLPLFILTLTAIIEFGWYAGVYSATVSASREAARYGSSVGDNGSGIPRYIDCAGIRAAARATTGALITLTDSQIEISYDDGLGGPKSDPCPPHGSGPVEDDLARFDRVVVEVSVVYKPVTPLLQGFIGTPTLVSTDRRSIGKPGS